LAFTALPKVEKNPVMLRRNEIVKRLEEQKHLATDPSYVKVIKTKAGDNFGLIPRGCDCPSIF
jgi:hypothetical protein